MADRKTNIEVYTFYPCAFNKSGSLIKSGFDFTEFRNPPQDYSRSTTAVRDQGPRNCLCSSKASKSTSRCWYDIHCSTNMPFLLQDEVALIGVIYKTHRSLPPKSPAKISSLYVLDSIARGVQKMYRNNKEKDPRTATIAKGFLTKVEGVLEDWTRDMCDGWPEGQVSIHILSFVSFSP